MTDAGEERLTASESEPTGAVFDNIPLREMAELMKALPLLAGAVSEKLCVAW